MKNIKANGVASFEIDSIIDGYAFLDDEWCATDVQSTFSRLYYIKKGYAYIYANGSKIKMTAGNVYLIPAKTKFSYEGVCDEVLEKRFFHFIINSGYQLDLLASFCGVYGLSIDEVGVQDVFECSESDNLTYNLEIKSILYKTIVSFFKRFNFKEQAVSTYSDSIQKAIDYIMQNLMVKLTLKEIATAVFVPPNSLRKKFKEEIGVSIGHYIDDLIIEKAKHLLVQTEYSIKEVSEVLGFSEQFYFSRRFKELTNKTPLQYRKENKLFRL